MKKTSFIDSIRRFEKDTVVALNGQGSSGIDVLSRTASNIFLLSAGWILVPFLVAIFNVLQGLVLGIGLATAFLLNFLISDCLIKFVGSILSINRERPHIAHPKEIKAIGANMLGSSFPSSHIAAMVSGFVVLLHFYAFLWPVAVIVILITAWSRMYNGMHYPSDILGGAVLGFLYGRASLFLLEYFM
ncbi:MAG TPA: phosphatase PAP2 family protein [Candidatus Moranbacteria bacterium]|jgi:undecaprenyl-diphosphatase|nr:phosphatase PAP2 family protein [Candidatus Moranbacteria bacterium]HOF42365.1 phosphatase PAP2 family protein [Candidatus Moranbacteria bacterium]HPX94461.1 phosphatase PAP2 family protein [Candidatus Moranbacteria bacterium]HQB59638.1 phosphatase PAP2 family protein [Candidatus Moranbacteria bacterium]